jgi:DNA topoisomerase IA
LIEPGYLSVYIEGTDEATEEDDDRLLPAMNVGDVLSLLAIHTAQHFTEPPPRFSEASLVKTLEEFGIGRPSTYNGTTWQNINEYLTANPHTHCSSPLRAKNSVTTSTAKR